MEVLLEKAELRLAWLTRNEALLRQSPTGAVDERRGLWTPLAELLRRAIAAPELEAAARSEAHRVWLEEMRHSALEVITGAVLIQTEGARRRFPPDLWEAMVASYEEARPNALKLLAAEELEALRAYGYLREGE